MYRLTYAPGYKYWVSWIIAIFYFRRACVCTTYYKFVLHSLAFYLHNYKKLTSNDLASSPGPSPPRRGLVHTACACAKYSVTFSVTFSVKSFVHFLVLMRKIILTKNTELSLTDSSDDLTHRTLLGYTTFQTWQYHFSKRTVQQKGNKSVYQIGQPQKYFSLHTRFVEAPPWTRLAFTTETAHDTALPSSEPSSQSLLYLYKTKMHGSYT